MEINKITAKTIHNISPTVKGKIEMVTNEFGEKTKNFLYELSNSHTDVIEKFLSSQTKIVPLRDAKSKLYLYDNMLLYRTNGTTASNLEENLDIVKDLNIAPKYIRYAQLGKDDYLIVMNISEEKLVPYQNVINKIPFNVKKEFKTNLAKLLNCDLINKEIFANKNALLATEDGQKLIFADWSKLDSLGSSDKQAFSDVMKTWSL